MAASIIDSQIFQGIFGTEAMRQVWSDENRTAQYVAIERALAIVDAAATGTWMLNTKSTPCIRALKTDFTAAIHDAGLMGADAFKGIRGVYFDGDMNAGAWSCGMVAGLIHDVAEGSALLRVSRRTVSQRSSPRSSRMVAIARRREKPLLAEPTPMLVVSPCGKTQA